MNMTQMMMLRAYASRNSYGLTSYPAFTPFSLHRVAQARPLNVQYTQRMRPVQRSRPTPLIQQQTDSLIQQQTNNPLDELIKLTAKIVWEVFKAEWAQDSPNSRKVWDVGAKLATSPSVAPVGQKLGAGLCITSLIVGLKHMDEASDD
jgi:hypothetical protein